MAKHTMQELRQWQALPLDIKVRMTETRIRMWIDEYGQDGVYVSFSGGKDSTVLLDIVRNRMGYKDIPAVFVDVPTQYTELRDFAKTWDNVEIIKPKISFMQVCEKYGFPLISKEVSECVQGARRYLMKIQKEETDGNIPYAQFFRKLTGTGEYSSVFTDPYRKADGESLKYASRGGYDRKYRKLRGLGEFARRKTTGQQRWTESAFGASAGVVHEREYDTGEYP